MTGQTDDCRPVSVELNPWRAQEEMGPWAQVVTQMPSGGATWARWVPFKLVSSKGAEDTVGRLAKAWCMTDPVVRSCAVGAAHLLSTGLSLSGLTDSTMRRHLAVTRLTCHHTLAAANSWP